MKTSLTLAFSLAGLLALAQDPCPNLYQTTFLHGNTISAPINNQGTLFWEGGTEAGFDVPYDSLYPVSTIFAANLWLGALDPGGNLKVAAQGYGLSYDSFDFWPGPLDGVGQTNAEACEKWNRFWEVTGTDISAHRADWLDNGVIDQPIASIFQWPGKGNPFFESAFGFPLPDDAQGLAPFQDINGDSHYDPSQGEYPRPENQEVIPSHMVWCVFNDNGNLHDQSLGNSLQAEVQLTAWALACVDNPLLNETIFTSYRIINRSLESWEDAKIGLAVDFDLGCNDDDLGGSLADQSTFYVYNADSTDGLFSGDCDGKPTYGNLPPVQAVTFLNYPLSSFICYYGGGVCNPIPGVTQPSSPGEYYNYLQGIWRDGTPMTIGGMGYQGGGTTTKFAFPDFPSDPTGWSMLQQWNSPTCFAMAIGATDFPVIVPGAIFPFDIAWSFHRGDGLDYLENTEYMAARVEDIRDQYDAGFANSCMSVSVRERETELDQIIAFPNPVSDILFLSNLPKGPMEWQWVGLQGARWGAGSTESGELNLSVSHLPEGLYFLKLQNSEGTATKRVVVKRL